MRQKDDEQQSATRSKKRSYHLPCISVLYGNVQRIRHWELKQSQEGSLTKWKLMTLDEP